MLLPLPAKQTHREAPVGYAQTPPWCRFLPTRAVLGADLVWLLAKRSSPARKMLGGSWPPTAGPVQIPNRFPGPGRSRLAGSAPVTRAPALPYTARACCVGQKRQSAPGGLVYRRQGNPHSCKGPAASAHCYDAIRSVRMYTAMYAAPKPFIRTNPHLRTAARVRGLRVHKSKKGR